MVVAVSLFVPTVTGSVMNPSGYTLSLENPLSSVGDGCSLS